MTETPAALTAPKPFTVVVTQEISARDICFLFVTAFEGGSTYWIHRADYGGPTKPARDDVVWWGNENVFDARFGCIVQFDDPKKPEGNGEGRRTLLRHTITEGLARAAKTPVGLRALAALLDESYDAIDADVLMQFIVLGKVVYG